MLLHEKLYLQLKTSYSSKEIWKISNFPNIFMLTPLFSPIFISYHCWVQLPFLVDLPDDVELCFLKIKYVLSIYIQPHQVFKPDLISLLYFFCFNLLPCLLYRPRGWLLSERKTKFSHSCQAKKRKEWFRVK